MTKREMILAECEHIARVFAAIYPTSPYVNVDHTMPDMIYVAVKRPTGPDDDHYLFTLGSDDDDYCFEPDDDNDPAHMTPIRFPDYTDDGNDDFVLTADDDSVANDDVIIVHYVLLTT